MMEALTERERLLAESIITKGLSKAAESLGFFMKEEIKSNGLDLIINKVDNKFDFTAKYGTNIHFLITEVIGELKGVCCLVFSEEEADQLRKKALPQEIVSNPELMKEMADAIMLEVDNIISASVITQFSNLLQNNIYGGVPQLKKFDPEQLNNFISSKYSRDLYIINFKTHFVSSNLEFKPEFTWLFDQSFLNSIKKFAQSGAAEEKLETSIM